MADKSSVKEPRSAAVVAVAEKLDEARAELKELKGLLNRVQSDNIELASAAAEAKSALDSGRADFAVQVSALKSQVGDAAGRAESLSRELAEARAELAEERSASASAVASKSQDQALIAGLRGEVKDLQSKLYRIRDAVKAV